MARRVHTPRSRPNRGAQIRIGPSDVADHLDLPLGAHALRKFSADACGAVGARRGSHRSPAESARANVWGRDRVLAVVGQGPDFYVEGALGPQVGPGEEPAAEITELIFQEVLNVGNVSRWGGTGFTGVTSVDFLRLSDPDPGNLVEPAELPQTVLGVLPCPTYTIFSDTEIRVTVPNPFPTQGTFDGLFALRLTLGAVQIDSNNSTATGPVWGLGPERFCAAFRFPGGS